MQKPIKIKSELKSKSGKKADAPVKRAEKTKNIAKISHTIPITGITISPENMNGMKTGLPLHKTFSSGCKCLLNWDICAPKLFKSKPLLGLQ
ncbi:MAG: hypothetical protein ACUVQW_03500 [Candidatus Bathycorpusculaceae bacterium]